MKDRLENSEAKVVVTTPELLERIPVDKLPHLQHVFVVGGEAESGTNIINYDEAAKQESTRLDIEWMDKKTAFCFTIHQVPLVRQRACCMSMKR